MLTPDNQIRFLVDDKRKLTSDELLEWELYEMEQFEVTAIPCEICGYTNLAVKQSSIQMHHIDGNHENNNKSNLMYLCANCHIELHALQKWKRQPIKWKSLSDKEEMQINKVAIEQLRKKKIGEA